MIAFLVTNMLCLSLIGLIDLTIKRCNYNGNWFQLHAIINYIIVYLSYSDVLACAIDPGDSNTPVKVHLAGQFAFGLHIYHCVMFKLRLDDWIHHISSVFIVAPVCVYYPTKSLSVFYFFLTGLPGGIDYTMLSLYKNRLITKYKQKQINSYLNAYIRQPGGAICSYLLFKDSIVTDATNYATLFLSLIIYLNSCFYGKQVIENYARLK